MTTTSSSSSAACHRCLSSCNDRSPGPGHAQPQLPDRGHLSILEAKLPTTAWRHSSARSNLIAVMQCWKPTLSLFPFLSLSLYSEDSSRVHMQGTKLSPLPSLALSCLNSRKKLIKIDRGGLSSSLCPRPIAPQGTQSRR